MRLRRRTQFEDDVRVGMTFQNLIQHDQMIREFVGVGAAGRIMLGQIFAGPLDCFDETVGRLAVGNMRRQIIDDLLPSAGRHMLVNAFVSQNFSMAFGDRHENQHAGAALSGVQVLDDELLGGAPVRMPGANRFRNQQRPDVLRP